VHREDCRPRRRVGACARDRVTESGAVESVEANAEGSGCFRKATKKGLAIEGWKGGAATVKILVPAESDTVPP
jgi:hypothetical protein